MQIEPSQRVQAADRPLVMLLSFIERLGMERVMPSWYDSPIPVGMPIKREDLVQAVAALADPLSNDHVDSKVIVRMLSKISALADDSTEHRHLLQSIQAHVAQHWPDLQTGLNDDVMANYEPGRLLSALPMLKTDPALLRSVARAVASQNLTSDRLAKLLEYVEPVDRSQARTLLAALIERSRKGTIREDSLTQSVIRSIGAGLNWDTWAILQAILMAQPGLAVPHATLDRGGDRNRESGELIAARDRIADAIEPKGRIREVAAMLIELFDAPPHAHSGLLSRPAEIRAAYVEALQTTIGDDPELRAAVIEALLWHADGRAADLANFAALALAQSEDRAQIVELERHPVSLVRYAARSLRAAKFAERLEVRSLPVASGLAGSLAALHVDESVPQDPARTWIGDRAVERLIERTIWSMEERFAREYEDHGDEGEDRLLSSLFYGLGLKFEALDGVLAGLAKAASAPHRASLTMRYRNIDRPEEGKEGVRQAKKLAADLLLVIDPSIDGVSLGRRVTMIQAKRLYRNKKAKVQPAWDKAFVLDLAQRQALKDQTRSSVYLFHGPPLGGRGVPVIPTELVAGLSEHDGSASRLATSRVATASRSLADWLTYDALALRVGDPYQDLVDRTEGRPGSLSRALLDLPTVEIDVGLIARDEDF